MNLNIIKLVIIFDNRRFKNNILIYQMKIERSRYSYDLFYSYETTSMTEL